METVPPKSNTSKKRHMNGLVVSTKMKDTVVVAVSRYTKDAKYGKFGMFTKHFKAHDAGNTCAMGDRVEIEETRPISKDKRFKVTKVLNTSSESKA